MVKKPKNKSRRNCKDGLTSKQELLARQIRGEILDENKKKRPYDQIKNLWVAFCIETNEVLNEDNFSNYVREKVPELHSAFKRLQINMMDVIKSS